MPHCPASLTEQGPLLDGCRGGGMQHVNRSPCSVGDSPLGWRAPSPEPTGQGGLTGWASRPPSVARVSYASHTKGLAGVYPTFPVRGPWGMGSPIHAIWDRHLKSTSWLVAYQLASRWALGACPIWLGCADPFLGGGVGGGGRQLDPLVRPPFE